MYNFFIDTFWWTFAIFGMYKLFDEFFIEIMVFMCKTPQRLAKMLEKIKKKVHRKQLSDRI